VDRPWASGNLRLAIAVALAATTATPVLASPLAHSAHTLEVRDEGHLRFLASSGPQLTDEGPASGTLPGTVKVRFTYNGDPLVLARFTVYSTGGSVSGQARGRLHNPNGLSPSFRGSLTITGGTGRYRHASGHGELFGVYYRRSYGLTVQAIADLNF